MFKILEKRQLSELVNYMKIEAPEIAQNRKAGQFVIVQTDIEYGERIPLTIADADEKSGWIAIVYQPVGASTFKLSRMEVGDYLPALLGPLGVPSHIEKKDGPVVLVGGGFGVGACGAFDGRHAPGEVGDCVGAAFHVGLYGVELCVGVGHTV